MNWFDREISVPGEAARSELPVTRRNQETNQWCWAASGEMIMDHLGTDVSQCDQANRQFGLLSCCQSPVPPACVKGGWPEFHKFGFTVQRTNSAELSWDQIVDEILRRRTPIAFTWRWEGGGGHMMVIYGYEVLDGIRRVLIHDPWPPNVGASRSITYDNYVSGAGYSHWDDFYNVRVAAGGPTGESGKAFPMEETMPGQFEAIEATRGLASQSLVALRGHLDSVAPGSAGQKMSLGEPVTVSVLRLDELKNAIAYAPGTGESLASKLLCRKPFRAIYPVLDGNRMIQAEVAFESQNGSWGEAGMGSPTLSKLLAANTGVASRPSAVVAVPALNQQFAVSRLADEDRFSALIDDPSAGFNAGELLTDDELLNKLIAAANAHDGRPR